MFKKIVDGHTDGISINASSFQPPCPIPITLTGLSQKSVDFDHEINLCFCPIPTQLAGLTQKVKIPTTE